MTKNCGKFSKKNLKNGCNNIKKLQKGKGKKEGNLTKNKDWKTKKLMKIYQRNSKMVKN